MAMRCLLVAQYHGNTTITMVASTSKERRKERNERRMDLALSRREATKEKMEEMEATIAAPRRSTRSKTTVPNVRELAKLGKQWYALKVYKGREQSSAEALRSALMQMFPDLEFEILCPIVPSERLVSGKTIKCSKAVLPGHMFIKCVMEYELYEAIKDERSMVSSFAGLPVKSPYSTKGNYQSIQMPTPVSSFQIEVLCAEAKKLEAEYLKKEALAAMEAKTSIQIEEPKIKRGRQSRKAKQTSEDEVLRGEVLPEQRNYEPELEIGLNAFITSGPYQSLEGTVKEFLRDRQVKVSLLVFGSETEIVLHASQLQRMNL